MFNFHTASHNAIRNENLQSALNIMKTNHKKKRDHAVEEFPEFEQCRDKAVEIKNHSLEYLPEYMEIFIENCEKNGGNVHLCQFPHEARRIILDICKKNRAKKVIKGKSMVSEEIHLNSALEMAGMKVVESDLGEYIVQLRNERPSHIIGPALHVLKEEVRDLFLKTHKKLRPGRRLDTGADLVAEARKILRSEYLSADVGITGANFLIASTGGGVIVTNEGNGDLSQNLPRVHIVITTIEKIIPTMNDAFTLLRLLARSGTGQDISTYTSFFHGAKRDHERDGPREFHVVILDNGRSDILKSPARDMLRCLKCGACMNNCPVYQTIGGHAYGTTYMGPIGSILSPYLDGIKKTHNLPFASSFCGRCEEVCPVRIPIPRILRLNREWIFQENQGTLPNIGLKIWAFLALRPTLYRWFTTWMRRYMRIMAHSDQRANGRADRRADDGGQSLWIYRLPMVAWTDERDFPAPSRKSFLEKYKNMQHDQ